MPACRSRADLCTVWYLREFGRVTGIVGIRLVTRLFHVASRVICLFVSFSQMIGRVLLDDGKAYSMPRAGGIRRHYS